MIIINNSDSTTKELKPTILICGYTGSGKTSLIQSIFGTQTVPDNQIGHDSPMTREFIKYLNEFIDIWDSKGLEVADNEKDFVDRTRKLITDIQKKNNPENQIHVVWYTIQGSGARVTSTDLELIQSIFKNVIVVITKTDITQSKQLTPMIQKLQDNGIKRENILPVFVYQKDEDSEDSENDENKEKEKREKSKQSLLKLLNRTLTLMPSAYKDAFESAQMLDLDNKIKKAQSIIHGCATAASIASADPIPVKDSVIITTIQIGMIGSLATVYGLPKEVANTAVAAFVAQAAGTAAVTSLLKLFPGGGNIIQAGVAFTLTEAVGQAVSAYMIECCKALIGEGSPPKFILKDFNIFFQNLGNTEK
ncbi:GTPase [Dolichospermum planctonicum]|uniref:GTP-binding protein n=1 Tax=Dolichospermum planctonicum TaxID=136072 RepID=A0A480AFA5_9CYAN|nr:GTPase [Dolichospermum planctonicum]GCL43677.1 GTP-binding protein [Dolichospermum planctonicum]